MSLRFTALLDPITLSDDSEVTLKVRTKISLGQSKELTKMQEGITADMDENQGLDVTIQTFLILCIGMQIGDEKLELTTELLDEFPLDDVMLMATAVMKHYGMEPEDVEAESPEEAAINADLEAGQSPDDEVESPS